MKSLLLIFLGLFLTMANAKDETITVDSITTSQGKTYEKATLVKLSPMMVSISHDSGKTRVNILLLPEDIRKKLDFDQKEYDLEKAKVIEENKAKAEQLKKQKEMAAILKKAKFEGIEVITDLENGNYLVNNIESYTLTPHNQAPTYEILLTDYPKDKPLVSGDKRRVIILETGVKKLDGKNIKSWKFIKFPSKADEAKEFKGIKYVY